MFAMFGASVLVPFVFGINPAVVLFMNGIGTLLFHPDHKRKSTGISGIQLCFSGAGGCGHLKMGI